MNLDRAFAEAMGRLLGPDFPSDLGLAVSGGGDSMAMLTLAHNWTRVWGVRLWVITVDHGLRPEAGAEAAMVAETCAELGWPHAVARWRWDGQGNLQDAARRARLGLIARWRGGVRHVALAHTADDLAEGFVMRLQRGAGADGLAAMAEARKVAPAPVPGDIAGDAPPGVPGGDFTLIRPCLDMRRGDLRHYLRTLHGRWVEDPSNDDPRFDRVRARALVSALADQGLGADALAQAARCLRRSRTALAARAVQVWGQIGTEDTAHGAPTGDLLIDRDGFARVERDTQARILRAALQWIASADYGPRAAPLEDLLDRLLAGGVGTLHGVEARMEGPRLRLFRELSALGGAPANAYGDPRGPVAHGLWDGRWMPTEPGARADPRARIAPLGAAGWAQIATRDGAPPYHAARSLPALWQGDRVVACDAMGLGPGGTVTLRPMGRADLPLSAFLDSH